jgi:hypothetical protein
MKRLIWTFVFFTTLLLLSTFCIKRALFSAMDLACYEISYAFKFLFDGLMSLEFDTFIPFPTKVVVISRLFIGVFGVAELFQLPKYSSIYYC